jgi:hypothetical protein
LKPDFGEQREEPSSSEPVKPSQQPVTLKSGAVYEGEWLNQKRHGFGVLKWPDGAVYSGYWKANKADGQGTF